VLHRVDGRVEPGHDDKKVVCVKFSKLVIVTGCWFISGQEQHPFVRSK
jgi:hypothetical protein